MCLHLYVSHSGQGVYLSMQWAGGGYPHPIKADTPLGRHPPRQTHPARPPPPPETATEAGGTPSYWNAFLFLVVFMLSTKTKAILARGLLCVICESMCLCICSGDNIWTAKARNFICFTSLQYLGQEWVSRSLRQVQGQGKMSENWFFTQLFHIHVSPWSLFKGQCHLKFNLI